MKRGGVRGNPVTAVVQAVSTGVRNVRALTRDSVHPIPQWAALEGCTAALLMAGNDDAKQASGQCWRAYACAQCVPVARTAGVRFASSSGRGQSEEERA